LPTIRNWAGNQVFRPNRLLEPRTIGELRELVTSSSRLRPLGSRHSFNDLAATDGDLVTLDHLPRIFELEADPPTVTIDGAARYGELCPSLDAAGLALHNLASLPHISVAGACATGTHGSGDRLGNLATAVSAIELVTANGATVKFRRGEPDFPGAVVALGALGVVIRLTLDLQPSFEVRQSVYERLPQPDALDHFDEVMASAESVSLFTRWREPVFDQVWLKRRVVEGEEVGGPAQFGATAAAIELHPIRELAPDACTPQLGRAGPWHERLPHFRLDHTPSAGDELQSEYFVGREHAVGALGALDGIRDRIAPLVLVTEIRTIAADDLWLSPAQGRASVAIHFTWRPDWLSVRELLPAIELALEPYQARPHWGKLFTMPWSEVRTRYPHLPDFAALAARADPAGRFRNAFLDGLLG
jgi:xylitol oxidase